MSLLDECIEALGNNTTILSKQETERIFDFFETTLPITSWGRIDWGKINHKIRVDSTNDIVSYLSYQFSEEELDKSTYILWDEAALPAVETKLKKIVSVIDDVTAVSFDTWIFCTCPGYVIEFYHEGEITIGIISQ